MRLGALAWRGLAARPMRTALTVIATALGVAIVAATLVANQAANEAVQRAAEGLFGSATLRVRAFADAGFTPRTVGALRRLPGVLGAAAVAEQQGRSITTAPGPDEKVFTMLVLGVDAEDEASIRDWDVAAGEFLDPAVPEGVLVSAAWARANGLEIGDELFLNGRLPEVPPNVVVGLLGDAGFGALGSGSVAVFQRQFLGDAFAMPVAVRYVDLYVSDGREPDVQAALDATLTEPFVVETVADAEEQLGRAQAGFAGLAFLFGLVALAVGAFGAANTLALTISERTREIGLLRAAGTTSRQVMGLFLRQGVVLSLLGSAAGIALGIGVAGLVIAVLRATRSVLVSDVPIHAGSLVVAFALGALVTMAGAAVPAVAAARASPLDALRPSRQPGRTLGSRLVWILALVALAALGGLLVYPLDRGTASAPGALTAVGLLVGGTLAVALALQPLGAIVGRPVAWFFGAQGLLGRANLGRDRIRTGLTVGGLAIGLATVVAIGAVSGSARATADRWVASILPGGFAIRSGVPLGIAEYQAGIEEEIGHTGHASPIAEVPAVATDGGEVREVSLAGIDPNVFSDTGSLIVVDERRGAAFQALRDGGAVLVPEAVAARDGLAVGSMLELALPGRESQPFEVAGLIAYTLPARSPDGALLISLTDARERFGATAASLWALVPDDDITPAAFAEAVATAARGLSAESLTAAQLADDLGRSLDRLIGLFDVLALLAVVIAGLGIVNTLAMGVAERRREIAILRSHGMTVGQVQAMVVAEATIIGAVGGLAAVATGLLVAWATVTISAPRDFAAGLVVPWPLLAAVILLGIGVAAIAGIYPARVAARTSITGSLKHFE